MEASTGHGAGAARSPSLNDSATRPLPSTCPAMVTVEMRRVRRRSRGASNVIVSVLREGDILVGHSGGGFDITHAADAAPELVSHVCYLAAGLPRQGRTWPEAMAIRADGTMGDFDVAGMLKHLQIDEDGSDVPRQRRGRSRAVLSRLRRRDLLDGPSSVSARSVPERRRPWRCPCPGFGQPTSRAASSVAFRTEPNPNGSPNSRPTASASSP